LCQLLLVLSFEPTKDLADGILVVVEDCFQSAVLGEAAVESTSTGQLACSALLPGRLPVFLPIDFSKASLLIQKSPLSTDEDDRVTDGVVVEIREDEFKDLSYIQRRQSCTNCICSQWLRCLCSLFEESHHPVRAGKGWDGWDEKEVGQKGKKNKGSMRGRK
jgi:hypothetical protein